MKNTIIAVVVLLVVGFGIYYLTSNSSSTQLPTNVETSVPSSGSTNPSTSNSLPSTPSQPKTSSSATTKPPVLPSVAVSIKNSAFSPSVLKIKTGTKVTWTNNDDVPHTVTFNSDSFPSSQVLAKGESYSYTFLDPGSVTYICSIHTMMKGSIIVEN